MDTTSENNQSADDDQTRAENAQEEKRGEHTVDPTSAEDSDRSASEIEATPEDASGSEDESPQALMPGIPEAAHTQTIENRERVTRVEAVKSIGKIVEKIISLKDNEEMRASAAKQLEKAIPGLTPESAKARIIEAEQYLTKIEIVSKEPVTEQDQLVIKTFLIEPILRGHLSAETLEHLAKKVVVLNEEEAEAKSARFGKRLDAFSNCNGEISISQRIIDPTFRLENGSKVNLRQIVNHEVSHTAITDIIDIQPETTEQSQSQQEMLKFANEILQMAQTAKEERIPQPQNIEIFLEQIQNIGDEYSSLPEEGRGTLEEYRHERITYYSNEILTDYAAIYLQSDGDRATFMTELMMKIKTSSLHDYLRHNAGEELSGEELEAKISTLASATAEDRHGLLSEFPCMGRAMDLYDRAFEITSRNITDKKIKECAAVRADQAIEDVDMGDAAGSFSQSRDNASSAQNREESIADAAKGLFKAIANGVDIMSPYETPAAGM